MNYIELLENRRNFLRVEIVNFQKELTQIENILDSQGVLSSPKISLTEEYPKEGSNTKKILHVLSLGGEWKVNAIVDKMQEIEGFDNETRKTIKDRVTMTASALYKKGDIKAKKEDIYNVYYL